MGLWRVGVLTGSRFARLAGAENGAGIPYTIVDLIIVNNNL